MNLGQTEILSEVLISENGQVVYIDKYILKFNQYKHSNNINNYGGKVILDFQNEPVFAELLILRILEAQDYKGVWVDTYRNKFWTSITEKIDITNLDKKIKTVIEEIYILKGGKKSGCFDVVAYKNNEFVFVELKRGKKDKIRQTQIEWLLTAKQINKNYKFIIVEWDLNQ